MVQVLQAVIAGIQASGVAMVEEFKALSVFIQELDGEKVEPKVQVMLLDKELLEDTELMLAAEAKVTEAPAVAGMVVITP